MTAIQQCVSDNFCESTVSNVDAGLFKPMMPTAIRKNNVCENGVQRPAPKKLQLTRYDCFNHINSSQRLQTL